MSIMAMYINTEQISLLSENDHVKQKCIYQSINNLYRVLFFPASTSSLRAQVRSGTTEKTPTTQS